MNEKAHLRWAKSLSWNGLAYIIIHLELELQELKPEMTISQVKLLNQIINIYETEKQDRLDIISKPWKTQESNQPSD